MRSDQDQRVATDPRTGYAYVTFDNSVQGGKGTAMYVSESRDRGATWAVQRVTRTSWDPSRYGVPNGSSVLPFIGDYDGIVSLPTSAGMTWTGPGRTYGTLPTNLEVYFGSVTP